MSLKCIRKTVLTRLFTWRTKMYDIPRRSRKHYQYARVLSTCPSGYFDEINV